MASYISTNEMFKLAYGNAKVEHIYLIGAEGISRLENYEPLMSYLDTVKTAGMGYYLFSSFSAKTRKNLQNIIFDKENFNVKDWLETD